MKRIILTFTVFCILAACSSNQNKNRFLGFWQGPHPEDPSKNFYFHLYQTQNQVQAHGYWTENNFYNSQFNIDSVSVNGDSISFFIPDWGCTYKGEFCGNLNISGGFSCLGEPFDSVRLTRNDEVSKYLTEAKPGCSSESYRYSHSIPSNQNDKLIPSNFQSPNDSLFVYSLIPEIIRGNYGRLNSFLLVKDGKLICEEYFFGYTSSDLHQIESSTKSVTSLAYGIAHDKKIIDDVQTPIYMIFPEYKHLAQGEYQSITVKHLLTMTAGFDIENDAVFRSDNRIDFALRRNLAHAPGTKFVYDGGSTEILGAIVKKGTGMFIDDFVKKNLFTPLAIDSYNWEIYRQDGYPSTGGSLWLTPRAMAKIGLLVLNNGVFDGQQIVSQDWITESTSVQTKTHIEGDNYGYQWWRITLNSSENSYSTVWANGWGSQFIYIVPELKVVIVTTGYNYENDSWAITNGISKYIYLLK